MTGMEYAQEFLANSAKMQKYNQAIDTLREAGFETVLRRLGEPTPIPLDHPQHLAVSAFENAERRGWFQVLEVLFDFQNSLKGEAERASGGDFGAKDRLRALGYDEQTIQSLNEEEVSNG